MVVATPLLSELLTLADLLELLGPVAAQRICTDPAPGTASETDWRALSGRTDRLYELVDGVLVEKAMGYFEAWLAAELVRRIGAWLEGTGLGIVLGADAASRYLPGLIRIPDVSFVSWERLPGRRVPRDPLPDLVPDLAVEVLSRGNTPQEMDRKLQDFFTAGVRLVWYIDPPTRSVRVFTAVDQVTLIGPEGVLDGGDVLPGFRVSVRELFERAEGPTPQ